MPSKPSSYYRPKNLEEALELLSKPDTLPLAGGTKLLANGASGAVVDLQDLGLDQQNFSESSLTVGAMTRLTDLSNFITDEVQGEAAAAQGGPVPILVDSIHRSGPNTYRNAATVGGVVASRLPDSEFLSALLVLKAEIRLNDIGIGLTDYLSVDHHPKELITEIVIPWSIGHGASERVARTPADYPIVSVTFFKPDHGDFRIAATGIDLYPVRVPKAEEILNSGGDLEEAAMAVKNQACHPGDFRGDADYRAEMAFVLAKRVLEGNQ